MFDVHDSSHDRGTNGESCRYRLRFWGRQYEGAIKLSTVTAFLGLFAPREKVYLSMDRTNWRWGKCPINVLMLSLAYKGTAIPIYSHDLLICIAEPDALTAGGNSLSPSGNSAGRCLYPACPAPDCESVSGFGVANRSGSPSWLVERKPLQNLAERLQVGRSSRGCGLAS